MAKHLVTLVNSECRQVGKDVMKLYYYWNKNDESVSQEG